MPPQLLFLALAGALLIVAGFIGLLYRLGGFTVTAQERRGWMVALPVVVLIGLLMAFVGPLPMPIILALNAALIVYWLWAWRSGRLRIDRVPVDMRDETAKRRAWMKTHRGLLVALLVGGWLATIVWIMVVIIVIAR